MAEWNNPDDRSITRHSVQSIALHSVASDNTNQWRENGDIGDYTKSELLRKSSPLSIGNPAAPSGSSLEPRAGQVTLFVPGAGRVLFVFGADRFQQIRIRNQLLFQLDRKRPGIRFGVVDGDLQLHVPEI